MVVRDLPKVEARVRFPLPALDKSQVTGGKFLLVTCHLTLATFPTCRPSSTGRAMAS